MTLNWGIIGSGDVVRRKVLPSFRECNAVIKGIASRRYAIAAKVAAEFNLSTAYADVGALLGDSTIDAVYIATPVSSHADLTIRAAKAGKHVLCEKPMALTRAEALTMQQQCRSQNVHLEIAYYRRYFPVIIKLKELLDTGKIGKPLRVQVNCHSPRKLVPGDDWRYHPEISGGGVLMDIGSHRIDLMVYLFGRIKSSSGEIRSLQQTAVEDDCLLRLQFESGVEAELSISWSKQEYEDSIVVKGERGKLQIGKIAAGLLKHETKSEASEICLPMQKLTHTRLIQRFAERISSVPAENDAGTDAIQTTIAIDRVYRVNNYFTA